MNDEKLILKAIKNGDVFSPRTLRKYTYSQILFKIDKLIAKGLCKIKDRELKLTLAGEKILSEQRLDPTLDDLPARKIAKAAIGDIYIPKRLVITKLSAR